MANAAFIFQKMVLMHPTVSSVQSISHWDEITLIFRGLEFGVWASSVLGRRERHLQRVIKSLMAIEVAVISTLL